VFSASAVDGMMRFILTAAASLAIVVTAPSPVLRGQQATDPQRQVFRAGAHLVRVDVYPARGGQPLTGLKAADFDLQEDGKPQTIEFVEFIEAPIWTLNADRRDPNSQRQGLELARDPRYRVFVLYLDAFHVSLSGSNQASLPIVDFLNRMIGPRDLFGVLTPAQSPDNLLLGQLTQTIGQQLSDHKDWGIADRYEPQPGELELEAAFGRNPALAKRLIALRRLDKVYSDLEGLVVRLGDLRDERKNIVFFSDYLASPRTNFSDVSIDPIGGTGAPPPIGVTSGGKLTLGRPNSAEPDRRLADAERARLTSIDFDQRFRELLRRARQANVSFYTVRPGGLDPSYSMMSDGISNLRVLADETDGVAAAVSNDIRAGLKKVADDLSSHYVLGYYTTNTTWNGATRRISVRLKETGEKLRARREYRAPTEAEMAAIREVSSRVATGPAPPSPIEGALAQLTRLRPAARFATYGVATPAGVAVVAEIAAAEIEGGRLKQGAEVQVMLASATGETTTGRGRIEPGARGTMILLPVGAQAGPWQATVRMRGDGEPNESDSLSIERGKDAILGAPIAFRAAATAAAALRPIAAFHFRRTERIRVEWPTLTAIDSHEARLLDRKGQPLQVPIVVTTRESAGSTVLAADLNLAPLSIGDYLIELTAKAGSAVERKLIAIRVSMAR
jgi:VWFA-related protein